MAEGVEESLLALLAERGRDDALLNETVRAARGRSPLVARLPVEEVRRHTRALIDGAVAALVEGGEPGAEALAAAERLGSDRARQGVPVAALLDGFQAGRSYLIQMVIEEGRALDLPADALLDGVTRMDSIATALVHRMVHAHRIAELEMARTHRESRVQTLRRILHGEAGGSFVPLDPARPYHCVVSDVSDPAVARSLEDTLAGRGLAGLVDGRFAALVPRLPRDSGASTSLLVAAPAVPPGEVAGLYELCLRALRAATAAGRAGLLRLTDLALPTATAAEPGLGLLLSAELLGALDPRDAFHRGLAETALAYLERGGRAGPAAADLHVHPNTVKYRIRRLREIAGGPPTGGAVPEAARWWWALRSWLDGGSTDAKEMTR